MTKKKNDKKKFLILTGLVALTLLSFKVIEHNNEKQKDVNCLEFSQTGEMIMEARQNNLKRDRVVDTLLQDNSDEALVELVNTTVSEAYEVPLQESVEDKEKAIADFKETSYNFCRDKI